MAALPRTTADRFLLPTTVTPSHYALQLTPDLQSFDFDGVVDIDLAVHHEAVSSIELHSLDINITKAFFIPKDRSVIDVCGISYNIALTTATLSFSSRLP